MVLYFIGLGLGNEKDITVRGLEIVRQCDFLYLETYTSILITCSISALEEFYGKKITEADRTLVEQNAEEILEKARESRVAFLVIGDPLAATTHSDLFVRAHKLGIRCEIVHNASIMNAVGSCGVQLYNFGLTVSLVFFTETWRPDSFYDKIVRNMSAGLHTLCLLDIKMKEQTIENMMRGNDVFEPPRFMTVNTAIEQIMEVEERREEGVLSWDSLAVGLARIGSEDQQIGFGSMRDLKEVDFGAPLHSLVLCAEKNLHPCELEHLEIFRVPVTQS